MRAPTRVPSSMTTAVRAFYSVDRSTSVQACTSEMVASWVRPAADHLRVQESGASGPDLPGARFANDRRWLSRSGSSLFRVNFPT